MATESIESEIDLTGKTVDSPPKEVESGDDIVVVVRDDTPEQDRGRQRRDPNAKPNVPDDEEIGQYTKGVQDRMKQMKWEYHEERRAKEEWQREHGAAVGFAKKVYEENKKLRDLLAKGQKTMLESNKTSAENEVNALKDALKTALETGDSGRAAEIQAKMSAAAARAEAQNHIAPIQFDDITEENPAVARRQEERQAPRLSNTMQDWMNENPWFNTNKRMTALAFGVHEELIEKGIPIESPRYFAEINKSVKEAFPNYYADEDDGDDLSDRRERGRDDRNRDDRGREQDRRGNPPTQRRTNVAAPARSAARRDSKQVELTQSELTVAKRMGITPQQYAREKIRLENPDV